MISSERPHADVLRDVVRRHKSGELIGIHSICSAHPQVLEACMAEVRASNDLLLIEATSNQVNQFGGYTGMSPAQFARYVRDLAATTGLGPDRLILGGDHLGPNAWRTEPAASAMEKACTMVRDYVHSGFHKIHLDASMRCSGDPGDTHSALPEETVAARAAELCAAAEEAHTAAARGGPSPAYVIGTEVPIPGGTREAGEAPAVTTPGAMRQTIAVTREAFRARDLQAAWERVIAVVVQPGVEFGDDFVFDYHPDGAASLSRAIEEEPNLVFEAHSTDYQRPESLRKLVVDHFAVLKVGPALTFAFREAVFALELIEREWLEGRSPVELSHLRRTLEQAMLEAPSNWKPYYHGDEDEQRLARGFSFSDRIRYYWPDPRVQAALTRLIANLSAGPIPAVLISQFLPRQFEAVREGTLASQPLEMVRHKVNEVTQTYARACGRR